MRIRTIKPEFFLHEQLFEAERQTGLPLRLAYIGLWCAADREGRFKWEPRKLGIQILPYDGADFAAILDALAVCGCIARYGDAGEYGHIPSWAAHQCPNLREAKSTLPDPAHARTCTHVHARESLVHAPETHVRAFPPQHCCAFCGSEGNLWFAQIDWHAPHPETAKDVLIRCEVNACKSCNSELLEGREMSFFSGFSPPILGHAHARTCMHVHARGEGKGREGNNTLPLAAEAAPKKQAEPADPRFKPFLDAFCTEYEKATGHKYAMQGQKDGSQLKRLLKALPDVQIDEWCHSLEWCRQVAKNDVYAKSCVKTTGSLAAFASAWPQILDYSQHYQK